MYDEYYKNRKGEKMKKAVSIIITFALVLGLCIGATGTSYAEEIVLEPGEDYLEGEYYYYYFTNSDFTVKFAPLSSSYYVKDYEDNPVPSAAIYLNKNDEMIGFFYDAETYNRDEDDPPMYEIEKYRKIDENTFETVTTNGGINVKFVYDFQDDGTAHVTRYYKTGSTGDYTISDYYVMSKEKIPYIENARRKSNTINLHERRTLRAYGLEGKIKWKSSNPKIATISSKGRLTAKKTGSVTISAIGKNASCKIKLNIKDTPKIFNADGTLLTPRIKSISNNDGAVTLSWTKVRSVTGNIYYQIYRSTKEDGKYTKICELFDTSSFTDTSVKNNQTYYYKVRAHELAGDDPIYIENYSKMSAAKSC